MDVSVIICTYAVERYEDFSEAVESILDQTYESIEIVLVIDGNEDLCELVEADFGERDNIVIENNNKNRGVSYSRTKGAELADGDVVAFVDDDAVAEPNWIAELVDVYQSTDAVAVGGRMIGDWLVGDPWYLPEEFYWLVGVTHRGFADPGEEVRNTFESNISFKRDVFLNLGGFSSDLGPTAEVYRHSEGAEIGVRLQEEYDRGVVYEPEAVVHHKIFADRIQLQRLCKRAFEQGVSKQIMASQTTSFSNEEFGFLFLLVQVYIPQRLRTLVRSPSLGDLGQLLMLVVFTSCVGVGYCYAVVNNLFQSDTP